MEPDLKRLHHQLRSLMRCCTDDTKTCHGPITSTLCSGILCLLELYISAACSHGIHAFRADMRTRLSLPAGRHSDILVEGWVRGQAGVLLAL